MKRRKRKNQNLKKIKRDKNSIIWYYNIYDYLYHNDDINTGFIIYK